MTARIEEQGKAELPPLTCYLLVLYSRYKTTDQGYLDSQGMGTEKAKVEYILPDYSNLEELTKETEALKDKKIYGFSGGQKNHWLGELAQKHLSSTGRDFGSLYLHDVKFVLRGTEFKDGFEREEESHSGETYSSKVDEGDTCLNKEENKKTCFEKLLERGKRLKEEGREIVDGRRWTQEEIEKMEQNSISTTSSVVKSSSVSNNGAVIGGAISGSVAGVTLISIISFFLRQKLF